MSGRRPLLTLGLVLLLLTAGCGSGGPTGTPTAGAGDPATAATDEPGPGAGETTDQDTGAADQSRLDRVTSNQTAALQQLDSLTIETTSRFSNASTTITTTRTVRVDTTTNEILADTRLSFADQDTSLRETSYSTGDVVYTRTQVANTTFYERQSVDAFLANATSRSRPGSLDEQFAFNHTRTADGDHRFTADSVAQYRGAAPQNGTVENVSALVRVDGETGLVTTVRIELVVTTDAQRISITQTFAVTARGETTVPAPDWLDTAKDQTE